jgi:hypothetical protein
MDEIISYKMCAVKVRNAKLRNYLTTHFTDMCIPNFFSLPNGVRRSTFDAGLVTKFGAFSSLNFLKLI